MADKSQTMRTTLSRVRGLGAAGHGVEHWWMQRVTAIALIPLVVAFVIIVAALAGSGYQEAIAIVSHPLVALILALGLIASCVHMRLGMQVVIEDYVHDHGLRIAALLANTFFCVIAGVAGVYAIVMISLGRILL